MGNNSRPGSVVVLDVNHDPIEIDSVRYYVNELQWNGIEARSFDVHRHVDDACLTESTESFDHYPTEDEIRALVEDYTGAPIYPALLPGEANCAADLARLVADGKFNGDGRMRPSPADPIVPADVVHNNTRRAGHAAAAVAAYAAMFNGSESTGEDVATVIGDLLGDLGHLANALGVDLQELFERARDTYHGPELCGEDDTHGAELNPAEPVPAWTRAIAEDTGHGEPPVVLVVDGQMVCPSCKAEDQIANHDRGERHNPLTYVDDENGPHATADEQDRDFHTVRYACLACNTTVALPDGVEVVWS